MAPHHYSGDARYSVVIVVFSRRLLPCGRRWFPLSLGLESYGSDFNRESIEVTPVAALIITIF